jgi:hypothetical protein
MAGEAIKGTPADRGYGRSPSRSASVPVVRIRIPSVTKPAEPLRAERTTTVEILAPSDRSTRCA